MSPASAQPPAIGPGPSRAGDPSLEVDALRKEFPGRRKRPARVALDGLALRVPRGQWLALLGPNGSGKSTLVRIISGVLAPDAGAVSIMGQAVSPGSRRALGAMSVVFQKPGLDPLLTVRENLRTAAALFGLTGEERESRISELGASLGLSERFGDRVSTLSGGYVRRADLARALLHRPELLILDEATAGLDHQSRAAFLDLVAGLRRESPALSILMATHLMDEAERADRVVMMARGRIVADGTPAELRSAGGARVVRVGPVSGASLDAAEHLLREAGLRVSRPDERTVLARADLDTPGLEDAVLGLTRRGLPFEIAPPNLGDAYLAATGSELAAPGGPA